MRFSFVGDLTFNTKEDAKVPAIREIGDNGIGINASVVSSKNNRAFVEVTGWKSGDIKTRDTDNKEIVVDWADRKDKDIIKKVAGYKKNVISLGDDNRFEFITPYDFCKFLEKHMKDINGERFLVTGQTEENFYNGKESKRFRINNLYLIDEDDERKNKLEMNPTVVYFSKDDIDATDFKEDKRIYINGYTEEFVSKKDLDADKGENRYIPQQFILDCSKIDFENERQVKQMKFNLMMLGLEYKDGKITNKLKGNKYYANEIRVLYLNGAQDVGDGEEITYDMLTDTQKMKIDFGMAELKDFAVKAHSYGKNVVEFRIVDFPAEGEYSDGMVTLDDTVDEFEDKIFKPVATDDKSIDDELPFGKDKDEEDDDDDGFSMPKPREPIEDEEEEVKPKKSTKKKIKVDEDDDEEEEKPKKKSSKKEESEEDDDEDDDGENWDNFFGGDD